MNILSRRAFRRTAGRCPALLALALALLVPVAQSSVMLAVFHNASFRIVDPSDPSESDSERPAESPAGEDGISPGEVRSRFRRDPGSLCERTPGGGLQNSRCARRAALLIAETPSSGGWHLPLRC